MRGGARKGSGPKKIFDEPRVRMSISLPSSLHDQIKRRARERDESMAIVITKLLLRIRKFI
jgi:hypothetical protein|tara:strand:+ start:3285 stop:3467 length:183 start_codon:yes stop_codon:yes gene_type:complete